jgi:D-proline reductase (dithiol) PrdB
VSILFCDPTTAQGTCVRRLKRVTELERFAAYARLKAPKNVQQSPVRERGAYCQVMMLVRYSLRDINMEHVRYIDKTRDYYRRAGARQDYQWAHHDESPFTPFEKQVQDSRGVLISTASVVLLDEAGEPTETARMMGTSVLEVFPLASGTQTSALKSMSEDHDRFQTDMSDVDAYLPLTRLRELVDLGEIGSLTDDALRILPNYSKRKVLNVDAPDILARCREAQADFALLTPV